MNKTIRNWLLIAFLLSFLAVGIPYWLIPYNQVNLPHVLLRPGLLVVVFSALSLRLWRVAPFGQVVTLMGMAVPCTVFVRVVWETWLDPTSHNLWPFEIILALLVGGSSAFIGASVGSLMAQLRH
ncbi:hypothetical protein [Leptolyngbya sp. PCC 6406]|uniref:hypothetical protein n=1 Tax=Leptolyngbya sp. PCC 6406 TaxID=1173264 RepID=UPI0002AD1590|nr:hypothetical protein [Leptolyngbya sp. PCC 6406]